ncbi:unnamed protein product [Knipowitschia caucasica]
MVPDLRAPQAYSLRFVSVCREQPGRLLPLLGRSVGYSRAVRVWDFPPPDCEQCGSARITSRPFPSACPSCAYAECTLKGAA